MLPEWIHPEPGSPESTAEPAEALETMQPELLAMTRLFGLPDESWQPPFRFTKRQRTRATPRRSICWA